MFHTRAFMLPEPASGPVSGTAPVPASAPPGRTGKGELRGTG
jgi:hypothetical protein